MSPESRKGATAPLELGYWLVLVSAIARVLGIQLRPCPPSFRFLLKHRRKLSNLGSFIKG